MALKVTLTIDLKSLVGENEVYNAFRTIANAFAQDAELIVPPHLDRMVAINRGNIVLVSWDVDDTITISITRLSNDRGLLDYIAADVISDVIGIVAKSLNMDEAKVEDSIVDVDYDAIT
ncbi:MAG: hypothetical protein RXQ94_07745 [Caldivirga sp.]